MTGDLGVESYCRKNGTAVEPELCRFAPRFFISISRDLFVSLHVWLDLLFDSFLLLARATKGDVCKSQPIGVPKAVRERRLGTSWQGESIHNGSLEVFLFHDADDGVLRQCQKCLQRFDTVHTVFARLGVRFGYLYISLRILRTISLQYFLQES